MAAMAKHKVIALRMASARNRVILAHEIEQTISYLTLTLAIPRARHQYESIMNSKKVSWRKYAESMSNLADF